MKIALLLFLGFIGSAVGLFSQSTSNHSDILDARIQGVHSHHRNSYVAHFLTGRKLWDYDINTEQFFLKKRPTEGVLVFDGVVFEQIELQYNLFTQEVIALLETQNRERYVQLTPDKVSRFSIFEHDFVQVSGDSVMTDGIYELAYEGKGSDVFIKRTGKRIKSIEDHERIEKFIPINRYYVSNEFGTFQITSKKKLIEAYQNSELLISTIKKHKVKFSKKKIEQGLVSAVSLFEESTNNSL